MSVIQIGDRLWQGYVMPPKDVIQKKLDALLENMFRGKHGAVGRKPIAIVTIGVQGAGKSTAIKKNSPRSFVVIDPDQVTNALLGKEPLPDDGPVFSLSNEWTHKIITHAIKGKYDFVYDTALPSRKTLASIKAHGYVLKMLLVHTNRKIARGREVARDMNRGWGRPGIGVRSHMSTRDAIATRGPQLVAKFIDELTVCDNSGRVMKCAPCPLPTDELLRLFQM